MVKKNKLPREWVVELPSRDLWHSKEEVWHQKIVVIDGKPYRIKVIAEPFKVGAGWVFHKPKVKSTGTEESLPAEDTKDGQLFMVRGHRFVWRDSMLAWECSHCQWGTENPADPHLPSCRAIVRYRSRIRGDHSMG